MDILISGAAGFIGTNFCHYILEKYSDYNIVCVDKLTYAGNRHNIDELEDKHKNFRFCQADICDSDEILKIFKFWQGFDTVVNFAAESHVDRSISSEFSKSFIDSNIVGVFRLLEIIKKYKVKKFIQVSTDEVYGSLGEEGKFVETTNLNPSSLYSSSKASADLIAFSYYHTFKMPIVVSRCSNNFGSYQYPEKLIPLLITNALEGKKLPIYGEGLNVRDWIHVLDHCRGIETLLHYGKPGEVYNFGGNNEIKNIEVAQFILEYLKLPLTMIEHVQDRLGHDLRYSMDFTKVSREFGWHPMIDFKTSLVEVVEWYKDNEDWWKPLKNKVV